MVTKNFRQQEETRTDTGSAADNQQHRSAAAAKNATGVYSGDRFTARHTDAGLSGCIVVTGQPGTGKTYKMLQMLARAKRAIFFDTAANIGHGDRQNPAPRGYVELHGMSAFVSYMRTARARNFRVIYHPGEDAEKEFFYICRLMVEIRDVVFAVDEAWHFCKPSFMPKPFLRLAVQGRHPGVTLIVAAQQPQLLASQLRSVASRYYVFRLTDPLSLDALRGRIPDDAIAAVPSLPDRSYILRDEYNAWRAER